MIVSLTNKARRTLRLLVGQTDPHSRWFAWECPVGTHPRRAMVGRGYLNTTTIQAMLKELAACTWDGKLTIDGEEITLPVLNKKRTPVKRSTLSSQYESQMGHSRGAWWGSPGSPA